MNLKELREKNSLTQSALAKTLGVSSNTISAIEGGRLKLSEKLSNRIKEAFGVIIEPAAGKRTRKAKAGTPAERPVAQIAEEAVAEAAAMIEKEIGNAEKKVAKRGRKAKAGKPAAKTAVGKRPGRAAKKTAPAIVIQSPLGGEITTETILEKVGEVDAVYVRVDQNKAYWVKGEDSGSVELW